MYKQPTTLRELNDVLDDLSLPSIQSRDELDALFERLGDHELAGRDRLNNALHDASNPGNRGRANTIAFLRTHLSALQSARKPAQAEHRPSERRGESVASFPPRNAPERASHHREANDRQRPAHAPARTPQAPSRQDSNERLPASASVTQDGNERLKVRAYGKKAAFCAESDITRGSVPTVRFEFASAVGEKQFDWANKLTFQLTEDEIVETGAVLLGFVSKVNFRNHGDDKKWLEVENQGRQVCLKAGSGQLNSMRIVPISIGRATALAALVMRQIDAGLFEVGRTGMLPQILHRVTARLLNGEEREGRGMVSGARS